MNIYKFNSILLIGFSTIIGGCTFAEKIEDIIKPQKNEIEKKITEKRTVSFSCNQGTIKDYEDKGWVIVNTEQKEIPCTWKTKKSKSGCNLKKDKGCRITVPDKMGKQLIYQIEKDIIKKSKMTITTTTLI